MSTLTFRNPRLVALALLVLIAGGLSALLSIGRQEDPTITNIFATITTAYPGADPARVEALVSTKIEEELKEIAEIASLESTSSTGVSIVTVELLETINAGEIPNIWSKIRDTLDDVVLPPGALEPEFSSDELGTFATIIAVTPQHGDVPMPIVTRVADELADAIRNVPGTKLVDTYGAVEEELVVTLDPARTAALGLTADGIAREIEAADAKVQAGQLRASGSEFLISVSGEITAINRLNGVVIRQDGARVTYLGDIASIKRSIKTPVAEVAISDGVPSILIAGRVADGLQIDQWITGVRAALSEFQTTMPASISAEMVFDQSEYTASRLAEVGLNMAIGIALVVAVLFLTLGPRSAIIVALVLPVVSLATLLTMNLISLPIHQMSVTGLIVALGLLVDAAIVMTDEIGQRLRQGLTRLEAVGQSVRRLSGPLLASTVTTALSFTPMILLPGPAGDFVGSIAIAVVTMLVWSLIVALTITPAIAGWTLKDDGTGQGVRIRPLSNAFRATLRWSVSNPVKSVALALVLPVLGFVSAGTLTAQFFPGVDRDQFHIEVDLAPGTPLAKTHRIATAIDKVLQETHGIEGTNWVVGRSVPSFYYNVIATRDQAPEFAQAFVKTESPDATKAIVPDLQARLNAEFPEARVLVRALVQGPPVDAPVELRFVGPNMATLRDLGDRARALVGAQPTVTVVRTQIEGGAPKLTIDVDEAQARLLGLDLSQVARQLEAGLEGVTGGSMLEGSEQLPVRVRFAGIRDEVAAISALRILPANAAQTAATGTIPGVPLSTLATLTLEPAESAITRLNGERINTVQAFVQEGVLPEEALSAIQAELKAANFEIPDGYRLEFGGDSDERAAVLNNLIASMGLIVTLSVATIVLTFNSFRLSVVTFVVAGLSAGLSLLALAVFQYPFGINAVIGVIGSIGVSINAAIIILTGLQQNPAAASGDREAMADVVMGSSRHIVSTTITTFGGFLPLILGGGGFWPPFAMSIAGGVLLSTVVSFYFTPPMFALVYRKKSAPEVKRQTVEDAPFVLSLGSDAKVSPLSSARRVG